MSAHAPSASKRRRKFKVDRDVVEWNGSYRRYDLLKEIFICFCVSLLVILACSWIFSSPDERPVTVKRWSVASPVDFAQTAMTELDSTSGTATYGPPYNTTSGAAQKIGPVALPSIAGATIPINTAQDFVLGPLETLPNRPLLANALSIYNRASPSQQAKWDAAYGKAVANATFQNGVIVVKKAAYGPVGYLIESLTAMGRSGALDGALLASPQLYNTDYTKPLLFVADGTYMADLAQARHMSGDQWGMMNETGNFPGQAWLWMYTMWYQVPPFTTSSNADALVWATMMVLTLALALVPFIPGLRSIPRWTRVYRIIWRAHYREMGPEVLAQLPPESG